MFSNFFQKYINVQNIIFFIISIIFTVLICKNIDIALLFFSSFVIACSLNPLVDKLSEKKITRTVSSLIVIIGVILVIVLLFIPTVFLAASEISSFAINFPLYVDELDDFLDNFAIMHQLGLNKFDMDAIASTLSSFSENIALNTFFS